MYNYYYLIMYIKWYGKDYRVYYIVGYIDFIYYLYVYLIFSFLRVCL